MSDLERELTTVLARQAGQPHIDPHAALAEHERRLAARARTVRNRSMAGVVAAVAAIGVSAVLVVNRPSEPSQQVATQPSAQETTAPATPETDPDVVDTVEITDFTVDGKAWTAYLVVTDVYGPRCAEVVGVPAGEPPSSTERYPNGQGCDNLAFHPGDPLVGMLGMFPVTDNVPGPLPHLSVWGTVPEATEITAVGVNGETYDVELLDTIGGVNYFLVDSKSDTHLQRLTIRDANGTVLREDVY